MGDLCVDAWHARFATRQSVRHNAHDRQFVFYHAEQCTTAITLIAAKTKQNFIHCAALYMNVTVIVSTYSTSVDIRLSSVRTEHAVRALWRIVRSQFIHA